MLSRQYSYSVVLVLAIACHAGGASAPSTPLVTATNQSGASNLPSEPAQHSTAAVGSNCCADLKTFYDRFRAAALATNVEQAARLTRFPLEIRGALDDSPSLHVRRDEFARYFPALLDADTEDSEQPRSARQAFAAALAPDPRWIAGQSFRIANFQFELGAEGWRLAAVYSDSVANESEANSKR